MPEFEAQGVAELAEAAKHQLRQRMRALRRAHPRDALALRSRAIVERVIASSDFANARSVGLFYPMSELKEVDVRPIDEEARRRGMRVFYPFLEEREGRLLSGLRLSQSLASLAERGQRFFEPPPEALSAARGDVDLLIVPALAAASSGHRLGYGAGFYDATLPDFCPPARAIVVVYDFGLLADLPTLAHDVSCDGVITDARALGDAAQRADPA
jgi:5-formyltetrahydrofolate cyclo-ligase